MRVIAVCSTTGCAPEKILENLDSSLTEEGLLPVFDILKITKHLHDSVKQSLFEADKTVILGDSTITHECFKSFSSSNPGLIIFSASPSPDFLQRLVANGLKKNNLLLVGVRKLDAKQLSFLKENKVKVYPMKEIIAEGIHEISDSVMSVAKDFSELYISIDLSVLDPSCAPGVTCLAPGGLTSRELLFFIHRLKNLKNLKLADIIGLDVQKDNNSATIVLAAKIVTELY